MESLPAPAQPSSWSDVVDYLRFLGAQLRRRDRSPRRAIDRDGIGAINDAVADVCRSLMDRVMFAPGTVDIHTVVDGIALRIVETNDDTRRSGRPSTFADRVPRQRGPAVRGTRRCRGWSPEERLHDSIACMIGLLGVVADDEHAQSPRSWNRSGRRATAVPEGTFGCAWRARAELAASCRGATPHITFLGEEPCSLRSIFARVATCAA